MFCKNCGTEINEYGVCPKCGYREDATEQRQQPQQNQQLGESKHTVGLLMGLFLNLLGLIIGLVMYNGVAYERDTFIKGWLKGFIISIVIEVVFVIIVGVVLGGFYGGFLSGLFGELGM